VYFDKAYYIAPDKGGAKPYALFARALRESKRCALGRWAARGKQYIVMIRPVEDGLVMQQLLYAQEVRSIKDIEIPKTEVKDAELKLAQQLIEQQASDQFDPSAYTDEVRTRIEAAVQKKVEGQEITMAETPEGGHRSSISWKHCAPAWRRKRPSPLGQKSRRLRLGLKRKTNPRPPASRPSARSRQSRRRARAPRDREPNQAGSCISTACATSRSCCACRAARFAR